MSDKPETLADIAAEIRRGERMFWSLRDCAAYADRIEAAAERERDEDRQLAAIAESDESFARCARCDRPERAPGNAAAMREALEQALAYCESDQKSGIAYSDNDVLVPMLRAALAAPARNADRFQTAQDAIRAFADKWDGDDHPDFGMFGEWLFATAEEVTK